LLQSKRFQVNILDKEIKRKGPTVFRAKAMR